jgi:FkbM family methyltransferase
MLRELLKTCVRDPLLPVVRGYIRHFPVDAGKRAVWSLIGRRFEHVPHPFVVRTRFGARMRGNTEDLIDRFVYYFGVWERNLTAFLERRLSPGDLFVDVGANIGYYTLLAARRAGPTGGVVSIEASPSIFRSLEAHLQENGVTNVRSLNVAASNEAGTLTLYHGPPGNRGESSILPVEGGELEAEVEALPLDLILTPEEASRARLVKIDVEGAEWLVVAGMHSLLSAGPKDLEVVVEVAPTRLAAAGNSAEELVELFTREGFHAYALSNDYRFSHNLPPRTVSAPRRIRGPVEEQTDVVFSRIDAEEL